MASRGSDYGMVEWLRSHRVELGPVYLAIPVLAIGVVAHLFLSTVQTAILAVVLGIGGYVISANRAGQALRKVYFCIVTTFAYGWILAARLIENVASAWTWLVFCLVVGGVLLSIPWWADNVKRTHVRMEHVIRSWPIRSERIRLGGTAMSGMHTTSIGWSAKLKWLPGTHQVDDVIGRRGEIEGALGLLSGQLRIKPDGKSTNSVEIIAVTSDPHAVSVPWEIPTVEIDGELHLRPLKAADGVDLGVSEDGSARKMKLWTPGWGAHQSLLAGIKGSGKSGAMNLIWAFFSLCTDAVQWGVDLKGGMELGPWRAAFDWVVTSRSEAVLMMSYVENIINERAAYCASVGWKVWKSGPQFPLLVVSIDEAASLLGESAKSKEIDTVGELARKGRAVGVIIIMATQYPTLEALGSTQIRQQIDQRLCFRMADSKGESYVIPEHRVDAHKLDDTRPGLCYQQDGKRFDPMPLRTYFISDETIAQIISLIAGRTPDLDAVSTRAVESIENEIYTDREVFVPEQRDARTENGTETSGTDESEEDETMAEIPEFEDGTGVSLEDVVSRRRAAMSPEERAAADAQVEAEDADEGNTVRLSEQDAKAMLLTALDEAGEAGMRVAALALRCTRRSSWLHDQLKTHLESGRVVQTRRGTYASADHAAVHSE